ncbi:MAG: ester cyclase [Proteobacteria bacterium]|nr:ester cyclase [Pseudomonadota bacterium]
MNNGREVLETWFRRVWKEQDQTAIEDMFPSMGEATGLGKHALIGPEDFKQFQAALIDLIPNIEITIDKSIEEGPWISAMCTLSGNSKAGHAVSITGNATGRIENGKILEAYNHWDFMSLWGQLGLLPGDCFERGLRGEKVV